MFEFARNFIFKLAALGAPWVVRYFYGVDKLNQNIKIRVQAEGDGIVLNLGDLPNVRVWLRITNLSPISIEFDRVFGKFTYGAELAEFSNVERRRVPAMSEHEFLLELRLSDNEASYIRKNIAQRSSASLSFSAYINSPLHNYQLPFREVRTQNVQYLNVG